MPLYDFQDSIKLNAGTVSANVDGRNIDLLEVEEVDARVTINKEEQGALGRAFRGHKITSLAGAGTLNVKKVSSMWSVMVETYKKTGVFPTLTITGTTEDKSSSTGKEVVSLSGVIPDEITLFTLSASDGIAMNEMSYTFDDFAILETLKDIKR
ncbi:phage tail tube protein [Enterococcus olivae]